MRILSSIPLIKLNTRRPRQVISTIWEDRKEILKDDVNMYCWDRTLGPGISEYLEELIDKKPGQIECIVHRKEIEQQVEICRESWDNYSMKEGDAFWKDISKLVSDFLDLSQNETGTLHLRVIDNDACRKFHTDGYPLRLFTTYVGKGSEWLPEDAVNRKALGTENEQIVKDESKVQRIGTGHVSIFKGELPNSSNRAKGIVHRSPEIVDSGEKRIILRVDI